MNVGDPFTQQGAGIIFGWGYVFLFLLLLLFCCFSVICKIFSSARFNILVKGKTSSHCLSDHGEGGEMSM